MRILYITNYFPPHHVGGYELHCQRLARWLTGRGHEVCVLTGTWRNPDCPEDSDSSDDRLSVHRRLTLRYWRDIIDPGYWLREWRDLRIFREEVRRFQPDITILWNMRKLAAGIVLDTQRRTSACALHLMDEWAAEFRRANGLPQFWARPAASVAGQILKPPLRRLYRAVSGGDLDDWPLHNAVLTSRALGELNARHGLHFLREHVSYITYDPALFEGIDWDRSADPQDPLCFLWAGRLCRGKGLHTTLEALDILCRKYPEDRWTLDFCGPLDADIPRKDLDRLSAGRAWSERVRYLGALPHEHMAQVYRDHDAFLFASEVHEGLPGVLVEAFAAGLPVVGTLTGGTRDILRPDENCLVFPMKDPEGLADAAHRLIADGALRRRLARGVTDFSREQCSNDAVFPRVEKFYKEIVAEERGES